MLKTTRVPRKRKRRTGIKLNSGTPSPPIESESLDYSLNFPPLTESGNSCDTPHLLMESRSNSSCDTPPLLMESRSNSSCDTPPNLMESRSNSSCDSPPLLMESRSNSSCDTPLQMESRSNSSCYTAPLLMESRSNSSWDTPPPLMEKRSETFSGGSPPLVELRTKISCDTLLLLSRNQPKSSLTPQQNVKKFSECSSTQKFYRFF